MKAWVIRKERHGNPLTAFKQEDVTLPPLKSNEVLIRVNASGLNMNGVFSALGKPISVLDVHKNDFHIAGSDASGTIVELGSEVKGWKIGDEIVVHCNQTCNQCQYCNGFDSMQCPNQKIWGYETNFGSFAEFSIVQSQQLLKKPSHLTWEESASYGLTLFTAYRMLITKAQLKPGEVVLIWGAAGGLGVFAIQLAKMVGAKCIGVISSEEKAEYIKSLGCDGTINRKEFSHLAYKPNEIPQQTALRMDDTKRFGKAIFDILGEKRGPDVVFEHVGQETFPASVFLANKFGRIVTCGATTGFDLNFDVRHLWMRQKQIIGSHFANAEECYKANQLVHDKKIKPIVSKIFEFDQVAEAHELMYQNKHQGNMVVRGI